MERPTSPSRRDILTAALALLLIGGTSMAFAATESQQRPAGDALVAYFSRSGNTRVITGQIHRALGTDLFEIQPATPYPEDSAQTVDQARHERDTGYEPFLKAGMANFANYDMVFLGFPI